MVHYCQFAHQVGRRVCKVTPLRLLFSDFVVKQTRRLLMLASFMTLQVAACFAPVFTLVAHEPLHVDAVDVSFVSLESAVLLALVGTLVTIEPLNVDAVVVSFV